MAPLFVTKWQGTGNDFVLLDNRADAAYSYPELARALCDRRFGVGADGLLVLLPPPDDSSCDVTMRIFNADGSEAETCGNGIRCVARYVASTDPDKRRLSVQTLAGPMVTNLVRSERAEAVEVNMGVPRLERAHIGMRGPSGRVLDELIGAAGESLRVSAVSMGNPHCVIFTERALESVDLQVLAEAIHKTDLFTAGANVEVAHLSGGKIAMRVWERGVGETWACGSGACAVAVVAILSGRASSPLSVAMRGGSVEIAWAGEAKPVMLTGPAERVFGAQVEVPPEQLSRNHGVGRAELAPGPTCGGASAARPLGTDVVGPTTSGPTAVRFNPE